MHVFGEYQNEIAFGKRVEMAVDLVGCPALVDPEQLGEVMGVEGRGADEARVTGYVIGASFSRQ